MKLTSQQINNFQEIYKAKYGQDISLEKAQEEAGNLIRLVSVVYRPTNNKAVLNNPIINQNNHDTTTNPD